ncbi:Nn.00g045330.m01.CDS01 [Neocucurbitaria sp. VM-36]
MTFASTSALQISENGENATVELTLDPPDRTKVGRLRRREGIVMAPSGLRESPISPRRDIRRSLRRARSERSLKDGGDLVPSTPSARLGSRPEPKPAPIFAPVSSAISSKLDPRSPEDFNWYWESIAPTVAQKTHANHFFANNGKNAKLLRSVAQFRLFPESDVPEVAFVGRSNVGKSSLLNAVVDADIKSLLARTSSTPGFTKTMNLYGLGPGNGVTIKKQPDGRDKIVGRSGLTIVDMPGYGEGSLAQWGVEIMKYIQSRKQLRRVFVLLDAEHGIKDKDRSLLASLRLAGVSHQVILSKMDKLYIPKAKEIKRHDGKASSKLKSKGTAEGLRKEMEKLKNEIQPPVGGGALGEIIACSAETLVDGRRLGIDHLRYAVLKAVGLEANVRK